MSLHARIQSFGWGLRWETSLRRPLWEQEQVRVWGCLCFREESVSGFQGVGLWCVWGMGVFVWGLGGLGLWELKVFGLRV